MSVQPLGIFSVIPQSQPMSMLYMARHRRVANALPMRTDLERIMSQQVQQKPRLLSDNLPRPSLQARGYLVDDQGREIAITERMIQHACMELEQQWVAPQSLKAVKPP